MRLFLLILLFPVFSYSQGWYAQAGIGLSSTLTTYDRRSPISDLYGRTFTAELGAGMKFGKYLSAGVGSSLLHFPRLGEAIIPVYGEVRITGNGKLHPYFFIQPGYGGYHGPVTIASVPGDSSKLYTFYFKGGFYAASGVGISYHHIYLQGKCQWINYHSSDVRIYPQYQTKDIHYFRVYSTTLGFLL